jgi:hypothetical protein
MISFVFIRVHSWPKRLFQVVHDFSEICFTTFRARVLHFLDDVLPFGFRVVLGGEHRGFMALGADAFYGVPAAARGERLCRREGRK